MVGDILGTHTINQDGFAGVFFHQGHMLIGGSMEHDVGMETPEYHIYAFLATNIPNDGRELKIRELLL